MSKFLKRTRIWIQIICLVVFFILLARAGMEGHETFNTGKIPLYLDPLVLLVKLLTDGFVEALPLLALIPVGLSLLFGRFFCGWICPLGAINQFLSHLAIRFGGKREKPAFELLKLKYAVLILVLISAAFADNLGMILDPITLLTRTSAAFLIPGVENLLLDASPVAVRLQVEVIGVLFLIILLLNFYRRRFFCNYICPLGALYGLLARFSPLSFRPEAGCNGCDACAQHCTYAGSLKDEYSKQDCTVCLNCVTDCNRSSVGFSRPWRVRQRKIDLGRRGFMGTVGTGALLALMPRVSHSGLGTRRSFVRPPGSAAESDFLGRCVRCGVCVQTCPTDFIQHAGLETGIEGLWTPVVKASLGFCAEECNLCTNSCPTGAIENLTLDEKCYFKIGTARVDRSLCRPFAEGINCTVCADACFQKAITFKEIETTNYRGDRVTVNGIFVDSTLCNGCGICEFKCPRSDAPGIILTPESEQRESAF
ncbi:MAG: 4Fe-4S binding protein [bacterium]|nr:4Fe-4S binding protein [bacterium]